MWRFWERTNVYRRKRFSSPPSCFLALQLPLGSVRSVSSCTGLTRWQDKIIFGNREFLGTERKNWSCGEIERMKIKGKEKLNKRQKFCFSLIKKILKNKKFRFLNRHSNKYNVIMAKLHMEVWKSGVFISERQWSTL